MRSVPGWKRKLSIHESPKDEVWSELESHLEARREQLIEEGLSTRDADNRAREELGDLRQVAAETNRVTDGPVPSFFSFASDVLWRQIRFAIRSLHRQPGFTAAVFVILTFVVVVISIVSAVVASYRTEALPFPDPERIVLITRTPVDVATMPDDAPVPSGLNSIDWDRSNRAFEQTAAWERDGFGLLSSNPPAIVPGAWVTPGLFPIVGARTALGRVFTEEDVDEARDVAVISYDLWRERFGGDSQVLGKRILAYSNDRPDDTESFEVIGVLTQDFWYFNQDSDLFVPLRGHRRPSLGLLREGVSRLEASSYLTEFAAASISEVDPRWRMHVTPLRDALYGDLTPTFRVLRWTCLLLFLVALGNISLLLLIRSVGRSHELSVRHALGAGWTRLLGQLGVEGVLLGVTTAVLGLAIGSKIATVLVPSIQSFLGASAPNGQSNAFPGGESLAWTVGVCLLTAVLFAAIPALSYRRGFSLLRVGPQTEDRTQRRVRESFVVVEIALSLSLSVGAGLMLWSAHNLDRHDVGFEPGNLVKASVPLRERTFSSEYDQIAFFESLGQEISRLPGVDAVGVASRYPFQSDRGELLEVWSDTASDSEERAIHYAVDPEYLEALGLSLESGRFFGNEDHASSEPVIVVSRSLAERVWPETNPIGMRIRRGGWKDFRDEENEPWRTIVGVVSDVRASRLQMDHPETYVPFQQDPRSHMYLLVRTNDPDRVASALPELTRRVSPEQPVADIALMDTIVEAEVVRPRFLSTVLVTLAGASILLTLLGMYTVVTYAVAQRRREVAVRLAIGAERSDIEKLFLVQALRSTGVAIALGIPGAYGMTVLLGSQLHDVPSVPVWLYMVLAAALSLALLVATGVPARRATRLEPASVLREL